jgi:hypothetical protein
MFMPILLGVLFFVVGPVVLVVALNGNSPA